MKFKVGERVIVRTYDHMPGNWNHIMFELMGKIVTIRTNRSHDPDWPYRIEEASEWVWQERNFVPLPIKAGDPNYAFMCRRRKNVQ